MGILWWILIGLVAGFLAGKVMRGGGFGLIVNILVGIGGAILGGWLIGGFVAGLIGHALIATLITAFLGACLLLFIISLFKK